jgi:hypothetical protein
MSNTFFQHLPTLNRFEDITDLSSFIPLPEDWFVVVTDVIGSREAIKNGKYKEVNTIGAACIVAIVNALDSVEIPYVFGGDGASICVPPEHLDLAKHAALGTKNMAKVAFGLELRTGAIPVTDIRKKGGKLLIAKVKVSDKYDQAVFAGGGLALADKLLKESGSEYLFSSTDQRIEADFTGLECRWDKISNEQKTVMSLLIKACTEDEQHAMNEYNGIIQTISEIVKEEHPITEKSLKFSFNPRWLKNEFKTRTFLKSWTKKVAYILDLYYRIIIGKALMLFNIEANGFQWGDYKSDLISNSDYRKFDDMLRIVLSCHPDEKEALLAFLDQQEKEQKINYGVHNSEAAIVTCMIKEYSGLHFHFVDGDDGGYAMAAIDMASKSA